MNAPRLTDVQVRQLLAGIHPARVGDDGKGHSAVPQQEIRAHLIRIFGFAGWDDEIVSSHLVFEQPRRNPADAPVTFSTRWDVCYAVTMRLRIKDAAGNVIASYEDSAADTAENQKRGDAHGMALRSATSLALKRCAINLGDQFGLGLYNGGSLDRIVIGTLVGLTPPPAGEDKAAEDVQADVPPAKPDEGMGGQDPDAPVSEARQEAEPVRDVREDKQQPAIATGPAQDEPHPEGDSHPGGGAYGPGDARQAPAQYDPEQASRTGNGWRGRDGQQYPQGEPGDPLPGEDAATLEAAKAEAKRSLGAEEPPAQGHAPPLAQARARHRNALIALHPKWTEQQRKDATIALLGEQKDSAGWPVTLDTATSQNWNLAAEYWENELRENRQQQENR